MLGEIIDIFLNLLSQFLQKRSQEEAVEEVGLHLEGTCKYAGAAAVGRSGKIYCAPYNAARVLCIDPVQETMEEVGPRLEGVGSNGKN